MGFPMTTAPRRLTLTALELAQRFAGVKEVAGANHNAAILAMLQLDQNWPTTDETPWCSAFVNYVAWLLRLPRSKDLRARSWLAIGTAIPLEYARPGFDVVILNRAGGPQDPRILEAPGHVGFYNGIDNDLVLMLGGNQGNQVSIRPYDVARLLGVRRLWDGAG